TFSLVPQYGSFNMNDLKDLQSGQAKNISDSLHTSPKTVYDFPSYWGFRVSTSYVKNRNSYSFYVGYNTTGGRIHYSDYSGVIKLDKQVSNTNFSLGYSYAMLNSQRFKLTAGIGVGIALSTIDAENLVEIYVSEEKDQSTTKYHGHQFFTTPEICFSYAPLKFLYLELTAGYHQQLSSSAMHDDSAGDLIDNSGEKVSPNWSGYRLGAGIGYKINLKK
ncbi:MAG TPA: type IX secretion system membrane protein PorP/SprF, partial [Chryseolinea sp.]